MALKSVYLPHPEPEGDRLRISGDEHHHLTVGRAAVGETVEVLNGQGGVWTTQVIAVGKKETVVRVVEKRYVERAGPDIILAMSLVKPSAFELALEKSVEVGVTRFIPVIAHRSNAASGRRSDRWTRIGIEAAKQSKRYYLPVVDEPVSFANVITMEAPTKIVLQSEMEQH